MSALLDYWIFQPQVWLILGVALVALDVMAGLNFFVLPVGGAATLLAALLFADQLIWPEQAVLFDDWRTITILFGALSLIGVWAIKRFFKRSTDDAPDINKY